MRRLLNTLYVTTPDSYISCEGENVLIKVMDEIKFRVPIINLEGIICFGYMGASPALMRLCCEKGVLLTFLSPQGRFISRVTGKVHGNVLLRRTQYRWADQVDRSLLLSRRFILAKMNNSRVTLQRAARDHPVKIDGIKFKYAIDNLKDAMLSLDCASDLDILRGIEGEGARSYFSCYNDMIVAQKEDFYFRDRNKRPPTDKVNALMSFLYTILANDVSSALESVGLDPQVGFLHRDRPGRNSLALDLMEEFRAYFVDRLVLSLINRRQVTAKGFVRKESNAIIMDDDTKKIVLTEWQKRKQEEIRHPYLDEKIPMGLLPYCQALLLARHMRGDLEDYPPFLWK